MYMKAILIFLFITLMSFKSTSQIQVDKVEHFTAGFLISALTADLTYSIHENKKEAIFVGIGMGCLAGVTKELYDTTGRGTPSVKDFVWTCVGASLTSVTLVYHFKK